MNEQQESKVYRPKIFPAFVSMLLSRVFAVIFVLLVYFFNRHSSSIIILFWGVIVLSSIVFTFISLKFQYYELKNDGLFIRKGIIAKSRGTLLYSQIQDVYEYQSLIARIFGVVNLQIKTMSMAAGNLLYLSKEDAYEIRNIILSKIKKQKTISKTNLITDKQAETKANLMPYELHPFKKFWLLLVTFLITTFLTIGSLWAIIMMFKEGVIYYILASFVVLGFGISFILFIYVAFGLYNAISVYYGLKYCLTRDFFEESLHFISKYDARLPYDKIQDMIITESVTDRIFNLSSLVIETGEQLVADARKQLQNLATDVPFLNKNDTFSLQDSILRLMNIKNTKIIELRTKYPLNWIKPLKKTIKAICLNLLIFLL